MPPDNIQRTLHLRDATASLSTENRHLLVRKDDTVILDLPSINVDQVMLFGRNAVSTAALICCMQHGIPVAYLSRMGKFYGRAHTGCHQLVECNGIRDSLHLRETGITAAP